MKSVGVLGAGSWGTALALVLARRGVPTVMWGRNRAFMDELELLRENTGYLPGSRFPDALSLSSDLEDAVIEKDILFIVIPSHGFRRVVQQVALILKGMKKLPEAVVTASKGIENSTLCTMTEILEQEMPPGMAGRYAVLSGPSFAREVADGLPTAVALAAGEAGFCSKLQQFFSTDSFRIYSNSDVAGVQLGGALKNVMAIASGISDGMKFGTNTRAALITRGLAEMTRLGIKAGANPLTFAGLAGLGDLVLTCTGDLSRNRQVGLRLGAGETIDEILASMSMVAEGVKTSKSVHELAGKYDVEMPITNQVYRVLYRGLEPGEAVRELMMRPPRHELHGVSFFC